MLLLHDITLTKVQRNRATPATKIGNEKNKIVENRFIYRTHQHQYQ